jgi:mycothiol synthase
MKNELPQGYRVRAPTHDDAQSVTDLIALCDTADYGEPDLSVEDIRSDWRRDGFVLERDAWLIYAEDGTRVAYGFVWDTGDVTRIEPTTCVHPNFRERGLEDFHIAPAEEWTRSYGKTKIVQWIASETHSGWVPRLVARGYHTTRHDYVMEIELNEKPPAPILADGFVMRSFERGRDERAVWACTQEAFRDHRGHRDLEFDEWWASYDLHPEWSPELSTVVTQGAEVVAAAMVFNSFAGGWIRQIGVRRPWCKKGLGLAILQRVFADCYAREIKKVGLAVDAENLTGATRLYERAGMRVKEHYLRYEKIFAQALRRSDSVQN